MPYEKRAQKFKTKVNMKVTELNVKQVKWAIRACEDKDRFWEVVVSLVLLILTGACCYSLFLAYSVLFIEY